MTLRGRLFTIISLVVLLVLAISVALLIRGRKAAAPAATPSSTAPTREPNVIDRSNFEQRQTQITTAPAAPNAPAAPTTDPLQIEQNSVRQLAKIFTERFNTYSSDNNWQNIKEVQTLVTDAMWKRISGKISVKQSGSFTGVTTEVLSSNLSNWSPSAASVTCQVRQTIEQNGISSVVYKTITISLSKDSGAWLVSSYNWEQP